MEEDEVWGDSKNRNGIILTPTSTELSLKKNDLVSSAFNFHFWF